MAPNTRERDLFMEWFTADHPNWITKRVAEIREAAASLVGTDALAGFAQWGSKHAKAVLEARKEDVVLHFDKRNGPTLSVSSPVAILAQEYNRLRRGEQHD
jgi:hypothetical protein